MFPIQKTIPLTHNLCRSIRTTSEGTIIQKSFETDRKTITNRRSCERNAAVSTEMYTDLFTRNILTGEF